MGSEGASESEGLREQALRRRLDRERRAEAAERRAEAIRDIRDGTPRPPVDRRARLLEVLADGEWHSADELTEVARFAEGWIDLLVDDGYVIEKQAGSFRLTAHP